jgi:hypothetical protein
VSALSSYGPEAEVSRTTKLQSYIEMFLCYVGATCG